MKKVSILTILFTLIAGFTIAAEVNVFNARHYKADAELYDKFTAKTGIKVNLINGKAGALEKRMARPGVKNAIARLAKKLLPSVRQKDRNKLSKSGGQNAKS